MNPDKNQIDDKLHWYKDAIIYELHIKAFYDSNGDGIGDFQGLMEKLDYLSDLGVTAVWVLPFYPSPLRDDGYDIADYYKINPAYGKISEFKRFLKEAHKRNLRVITELVINHTSDQHPWFQRARQAPKGSQARNVYVWSDDPEKYSDVRIIFQDFESSNWTWDPVAQQYYWHRFFHHQPDLNYDNPWVQKEVFKIIDYWCRMGVDGFRLDAVPYLFEREGTNGENLPETHDFLKKLRAHVDANFPGTLLLAEANMWPEDSASYFGDGDECHMNYHFPVMPRMFMSLQMEDRYPITDIFEQTPEIPNTCQWAIFLRNHDELTLEMVTDEERDYMYKAYAKDPKARINLGIRHRLAPLMQNDRKKIELLNCLLFSLPGTPVIYYGDEIGMGDNFYLGDRDGVRTPMQWSPDRNAGFSQTNPQKLYLPVILDPEYSYESVNVETQRRNTSSLLWWMKRSIYMRKKFKAFGRGDLKFIHVENSKVLAFCRSYEEETILVIVNLSHFAQSAEILLEDYPGYVPVEVFSKNRFPQIQTDKPSHFTLSPYAYYWFHLQKVQEESSTEDLPQMEVSSWKKFLDPKVLEVFAEKVLPTYLPRTRWYGGKARTVQSLEVADKATLPHPDMDIILLLVQVNYENGLPDIYQLPVIHYTGDESESLREKYSAAAICNLKIGAEQGILFDAFYSPELQQYLLRQMANRKTVSLPSSDIRFYSEKGLKKYLRDNPTVRPKILGVEQSNTSVVYDNDYFLKMYRKLDRSINPDMEISRFLSEETKFDNVPRFVGAVEWRYGGDTMVLGMLQELVANHGDAWKYMLQSVHNYNEQLLSLPKEELELPAAAADLFDMRDFESLPEQVQERLTSTAAERISQLGVRTGEMHIALASRPDLKDFKPENFSLHYQRSLFSSLQSLVRVAYDSLSRQKNKLPKSVKTEAEQLYSRTEVLKVLKRIYQKKFDIVKIRNHGDYHLGQVLFTGKDLVILDFEGEPSRTFSERRLKRSGLRDVAGMLRSFHYAAYAGLLLKEQFSDEDITRLMPWAEEWYHLMGGIFLKAYLKTVRNTAFVPDQKQDLRILLETYLLEKAIYELNYELNNRPDWTLIPLRGISSIMRKIESSQAQ